MASRHDSIGNDQRYRSLRRSHRRENYRQLRMEDLEERRMLSLNPVLISRTEVEGDYGRQFLQSSLGSYSSITNDVDGQRLVAFSTNDHIPPGTGNHANAYLAKLNGLSTEEYVHLGGGTQDATLSAVSANGKYAAWVTQPVFAQVILGPFPSDQVYIHPIEPGIISLLNRETGGRTAISFGVAGNVWDLSMTDDGSVVYMSNDAELRFSHIGPLGPFQGDQFSTWDWYTPGNVTPPRLQRLAFGATEGVPVSVALASEGVISDDGNYLAYVTGGSPVVRRLNLLTGIDDIIATTVTENTSAQRVAISANGRFVAYVSAGLTPQVYLKDMDTGTVTLISKTASEVITNGTNQSVGSVSDDGRFVSFQSNGGSLLGNTSTSTNAFVKDVRTRRLETANNPNPSWNAGVSSISGDGRYVVFHEVALFAGAFTSQVYVAYNWLSDNLKPTGPASLQNAVTLTDALFSYQIPAGSFTDRDARPGDTLSYTAGLAGGAPLPGWLQLDSDSGQFSGTPTPGDVGTFQIIVTVTDKDGGSTSSSFWLTVVNPPRLNRPIVDLSHSAQASFFDILPADTFVIDGEIDSSALLVYSAALVDGSALPPWLSFNSSMRQFAGYSSNATAGEFEIRVTATDFRTIASAFADFTLTITPTAEADPQTVYVNSNWNRVARGADPDGAGPAMRFDYDAFASLQFALNAVAHDGTVIVYAGSYFPGGVGGGPNSGPNGAGGPIGAAAETDDGFGLPLISNYEKVVTIDLQPAVNFGIVNRWINVNNATLLLDEHVTLRAKVDAVDGLTAHVFAIGSIVLDSPTLTLTGNKMPVEGESFSLLQATHINLQGELIQGGFEPELVPFATGAMQPRYRRTMDPQTFQPAAVDLVFVKPPIANNDRYTVDQGDLLHIGELGFDPNALAVNDTDSNGNPIPSELFAYVGEIVASPLHAELFLVSNPFQFAFQYKSKLDFIGEDHFTYRIVVNGVPSNVATVTINVTPANRAPVAMGDTYESNEDSVLVGSSVLANDSDLHNGELDENNLPLTALLATAPVNAGTFTLNVDGTFTYLPAANFNGTDSFTYRAVDSLGAASNPVFVQIVVRPVNDPLVANDDVYTVPEGDGITIQSPGVLSNDGDADRPGSIVGLTAKLITPPQHGKLVFNDDGSFVYIHNGSETTIDSFTYCANDGPDLSNTAVVTINIAPADDLPRIIDDSVSQQDRDEIVSAPGDLLVRGSSTKGLLPKLKFVGLTLDVKNMPELTEFRANELERIGGEARFIDNPRLNSVDLGHVVRIEEKLSARVRKELRATVAQHGTNVTIVGPGTDATVRIGDLPTPSTIPLEVATSSEAKLVTVSGRTRDGRPATIDPLFGIDVSIGNGTPLPIRTEFIVRLNEIPTADLEAIGKAELITIGILSNEPGSQWDVMPILNPDAPEGVSIEKIDENSDGIIDVVVLQLTTDHNSTFAVLLVTPTDVNVPPVVNVAGPSTGVPGQPLTFTFSAIDPDSNGPFTYRIDWNGNGQVDEVVSGPASGLTRSHVFSEPKNYVVQASAHDGEDAGSLATQLVSITPFLKTADFLFVGGTPANDVLQFQSAKGGGVRVQLNSADLGTFNLPTSGHLIAYGGDGNDVISVAAGITLRAVLDGAAGVDVLTAGSGPSVLVGGDGIDILWGGSGRNVLIGGRGSDLIYGGKGDELMIAGTTKFDDDLVALLAVSNEWNSTRSYEQRVANLRGSGSGPRLNGAHFLSKDTVFDDNSLDLLLGAAGRDWFFANYTQPGSVFDFFDLSTKDKETAEDVN